MEYEDAQPANQPMNPIESVVFWLTLLMAYSAIFFLSYQIFPTSGQAVQAANIFAILGAGPQVVRSFYMKGDTRGLWISAIILPPSFFASLTMVIWPFFW